MTYPIPKASAEAWQAYQKTTRPRNVGLIFDRFVQDWGSNPDKEAKKKAWREIAAQKADADLLKEWHIRWEAMARAVHAEPFSLKTDWRFVAGLGRKGPLEAGFTFHRYGFPILPGSSVKGIARAYAWLVEERRESDPDFLAVFGDAPQGSEEVAQSGGAVFFDAIPASPFKLELDIMNPHFPDYYQGDKFPTDWQSPHPVYFLTVAAGTEFRFAIGWRKLPNVEARRLQDLAQKWLIGGLAKLGAGAKTSAGYGYFVSPESAPMPEPSAKIEAMEALSPAAPPAPPVEQKTGKGKVCYDKGRAYIVDQVDPSKRTRVNWQELGMNSLADKTLVEYTYEEGADGQRKVVRVQRELKR